MIYRRVDDEFIDPLVFRKDSLLGVPGLFDAYRRGNVAIANAPGTGVADDKVVYAYLPDMIRYYLEEEPVLPNVPTFLCWREKDRRHVIENIAKMVVKTDSQSGGYGMLMGPTSTKAEQDAFVDKINKSPRSYIAQPMMSLSKIGASPATAADNRKSAARGNVQTHWGKPFS